MLERTLVLVKPDGVQRGLIGEVISRLENVGLKIIGLKMRHIDRDFAGQHYTMDIAEPVYERSFWMMNRFFDTYL